VAKDLKKFVNPRFLKTVDIGLMQRLLTQNGSALQGLDLSLLARGDAASRQALRDFFAGPEENYPERLVRDLHCIAELGTANGLQLLLEQARRSSVEIKQVLAGDPADEQKLEPKHVALRMFIEHRDIFDSAADMLNFAALSSFAEFQGEEEGIEADIDDAALDRFRREAEEIFNTDLRGRYCAVESYEDGDEINIVVKHGAPFKTTEVIQSGADHVISYRETVHAVLSYSSLTGILKVGGVAKARREDLAEVFAAVLLHRPGFFAAPDAQDLYTLRPIERAGFGFEFKHDFDPSILRVQITEVQADRIGIDRRSGEARVFYSHTIRDARDNALARLGEDAHGIRFGPEWRLAHVVLRVHINAGERKPARVAVKVKPPRIVSFKRQRFENRIMMLLRRNGFVNDRQPDQVAIAAE